MRTIKFRTWYGGKMHKWGILNDGATGTKTFLPPIDLFAPQMQFTGLVDKNGKEIYEGDYLIDGDSEPTRHRIVWYDDQAKFELETWMGGEDWETGVWGDDLYNLTNKNKLEDFEVIGNIYENPELLTPLSQ